MSIFKKSSLQFEAAPTNNEFGFETAEPLQPSSGRMPFNKMTPSQKLIDELDRLDDLANRQDGEYYKGVSFALRKAIQLARQIL